jgi:putative two-component system response regulator
LSAKAGDIDHVTGALMTPTVADTERVLVVDDEPEMCRILERILAEAGYRTTATDDPATAHKLLAEGDVWLMITDARMPGESGIDLLRSATRERPDLATLMISGIDDPGVADAALDSGAYGYLTKPIRATDVIVAVSNALRRRELELEHRLQRDSLERLVEERTATLRSVIERLETATDQLAKARDETVRAFARATEVRDLETGCHIERMSRYCGFLAEAFRLHAPSIRAASQMHDIGKIGVPDSVLLKRGPLTPAERRVMERHTTIGYDLLRESESELLKYGAVIALTHHERWDGNGYPAQLHGEDIPIEGRIAAVADVFDALTTDRVYRPAMSIAQAVKEMRGERGRHFDPEVLDCFLGDLNTVVAIREEFTEPR